jgi:hypothetical protein
MQIPCGKSSNEEGTRKTNNNETLMAEPIRARQALLYCTFFDFNTDQI